MVAVLVLVSEKKPDEVWMTFVLAAESLENLDLSLVLFSLLSTECFDGEVLFIGALSAWNMLAMHAVDNTSRSLGGPLLTD